MFKHLFSALMLSAVFFGTVRAGQERPKIGLVLGGGGALGLAHVGVIQVLEELQIPIDYIGGTSMGAIAAGMYASGMSPVEMEQAFVELNWWDILKDQSSHEFLVYRRKEDDARYMGAELGFNGGRFQFRPGMAQGQKLNNVLETFALNAAGITDFDQLNIPYRAVATDLRKAESVVLDHGRLAHAMRASMAVPGVFTPIRIDGRVFIDGGIYSNIPVDMIKAMGADIIIAVDVGASSAKKSGAGDFRSVSEVLGRTYTIMQRPNQEAQLKHADLVIAPDLEAFSSTQFHKAAVIIPQGRKAAEALREQLQAYSADDETYRAFLARQRLKHREQVRINEVRITGQEHIDEEVIRHRIHSTTGPLNLETVYTDLNRIYGMGNFETVTFDLEPSGEEYALIYDAREKYWGPGFLRFGMRIEMATNTSMLWSLLLNYTRTQLNANGGEMQIDVEGGGMRRGLEMEWYQPFSRSGRFFFAPAFEVSDEDIDLYQDDDVYANIDQQQVTGHFDLGVSGFQYGEIRLGLQGTYTWSEGQSGIINLGKYEEPTIGYTASLRLDQLDDPVFPTKGYQLHLDGLAADHSLGSESDFNRAEGSLLLPFSFGRHTLIPKIQGGASFGTDLPFHSIFQLGGMDSFAGYAPYQRLGNYYALASLGYRCRITQLPPALGTGVFGIVRADAGNAWFDRRDVRIDNLQFGALIGLAADTVIGNSFLAVGQADDSNHVRVYFSLGNDF